MKPPSRNRKPTRVALEVKESELEARKNASKHADRKLAAIQKRNLSSADTGEAGKKSKRKKQSTTETSEACVSASTSAGPVAGMHQESSNKKSKKAAKKVEPPFPLYPPASFSSSSRSKPLSSHEGFAGVVNLLRRRKNIVVLTGAGISVSCGIPDFRSKGTGLYSTLDFETMGLSCPEDLFDWDFFQDNPGPFFQFARNLYFPLGTSENEGSPQRVRPSESHELLTKLEANKQLLRVYTQNIDGLEERAGVSSKKVVYAHGSLQWAQCLKCQRRVRAEDMEDDILAGTVAYCGRSRTSSSASSGSRRTPETPGREGLSTRTSSANSLSSNGSADVTAANDSMLEMTANPRATRKRARPTGDTLTLPRTVCGGVLKPGVTFFGEPLRDNVGRCLELDFNKVDALIVIGTSLSVAPISKVIGYLPSNIPRILINRNIAHPAPSHCVSDDDEHEDFRQGKYLFDAYLLGFCDDITRALAKELFGNEDEAAESGKQSDAPKCRVLASVCSQQEESKRPGNRKRALKKEHSSLRDYSFVDQDWSSVTVPSERVFLFPGALAPAIASAVTTSTCSVTTNATVREIAHCDGCGDRITGIIHKCSVCFDYDLCRKCFPRLSQEHHNGTHSFRVEDAG